jgi:hypothetical protein
VSWLFIPDLLVDAVYEGGEVREIGFVKDGSCVTSIENNFCDIIYVQPSLVTT